MPDTKTIWLFRERLIRAGAIEALFTRFDQAIREAGHTPMAEQIIDASLISAPKQPNTAVETAAIKAGQRAAELWPDTPAKARQKNLASSPI